MLQPTAGSLLTCRDACPQVLEQADLAALQPVPAPTPQAFARELDELFGF